MSKQEYQEYLFSKIWKEKAQRRLEIDGFRCVMCGCMGTRTNRLEVHHISYKNVGREDVFRDILTLCKCCHRNVHAMMNRITAYRPDGTPIHGWKDQLSYTAHVYSLDGAETSAKYS